MGTSLRALGTCGGNHIGQSPQSTKQQDRHHGVTRSRERSAGHMLSFPLGLAARGQGKGDLPQAGKPLPGREWMR